jgi:hypothetical protein
MSLTQVLNSTLDAAQENPVLAIGLCAVAATVLTTTAVVCCFSKKSAKDRARQAFIDGQLDSHGNQHAAHLNANFAQGAASALKKRQ